MAGEDCNDQREDFYSKVAEYFYPLVNMCRRRAVVVDVEELTNHLIEVMKTSSSECMRERHNIQMIFNGKRIKTSRIIRCNEEGIFSKFGIPAKVSIVTRFKSG